MVTSIELIIDDIIIKKDFKLQFSWTNYKCKLKLEKSHRQHLKQDTNFELLIWGFACDRIIKLQKKAMGIISVSKYNAHTDLIFKQLHLLTQSNRYS